MNLKIQCPNPECGKSYSISDNQLGRNVVCKSCGKRFTLSGSSVSPAAASADTGEPAAEDTMQPAGIPKKLGRFEVRTRVGHGAFGVVYRGYDPTLDREVALKVPHRAALLSEKRKARVLVEAKAAAQLRHPNVVPVYEAGQDGDIFYIASAFIEGQTLEDAIDKGQFQDGSAVTRSETFPRKVWRGVRQSWERTGLARKSRTRRAGPQQETVAGSSPSTDSSTAGPHVDFRRVAKLIMDLARGLDYAHRLGIVHRDVKPANIMLDRTGDPLVTDFGLARLDDVANADSAEADGSHGPPPLPVLSGGSASARATQDGTVLGTPAYMAPEQARAQQALVGPVSDQYSLGAVLYELCCGQPPFSGPQEMVLSLVRSKEEPQLPRSVNPEIPVDLEAICIKTMSKDTKGRYGSCGEMAEDLRRWLDGDLIHARRLSAKERAVRWCRRNPAVAGLSAAVVVVLLLGAMVSGVLAARARSRERDAVAQKGRADNAAQQAITEKDRADNAAKQAIAEKDRADKTADDLRKALEETKVAQRLRALAQVDSLRRAEIGQVPYIIDGLKPVWPDVGPRVIELMGDKNLTENERLRLSLALVWKDAKLVEYLFGRLLEATPTDFLVVREGLVPYAGRLTRELWRIALDQGADPNRRFRAACALARLDSGSQGQWSAIAKPVVSLLVAENPLVLGTWMEALRPARNVLVPRLQDVFRDRQISEGERSVAASILADYAADQPQVLADVLLDADTRHFAAMFPSLRLQGQHAVALLEAELDRQLAEEANDEERDRLASRQANAAAALLRMAANDKAWAVFRHCPDPTARSYLIHRVAPLEVDPRLIVTRLDREQDVSIHRALLLSLGEFGEKQLPLSERQQLIPKLLERYRGNSDAGVHAAVEWLLRQWGQHEAIKVSDQQLARGEPVGDSRWYVNSQGQTMVVFRGPIEFQMGSPETETNREPDEPLHSCRIGRSFAIAAKEVTVEQWERFQAKTEFEGFRQRFYPDATCPNLAICWYEAAAYCNWLSLQEGLPRSEWCYEQNEVGEYYKGMKPAKDYLERSGYRLPSPAEWEYACRAGASTCRYFGRSKRLLVHYAFYQDNSQDRSWPVATLKPNDAGLFDVLGNAEEWTHSRKVPSDQDDLPDQDTVANEDPRELRGGLSAITS